jgi:hypothetical protein
MASEHKWSERLNMSRIEDTIDMLMSDTSQMYLILQVPCSMICFRMSPYLGQTVESDAVFSKSHLSNCFAGNKIKKNVTEGFHQNKGRGVLESHERGHEAQNSTSGTPTSIGRATWAIMALKRRIATSFRVPPYKP